MPAIAATITRITGLRGVKILPSATTVKIANVNLSMTAFLRSFITALKISTHTHTRMPPNACCTQTIWENASITPAKIEIIINEGNTTPSVAKVPPAIPLCFCPINVAVFTAIIPGVHCPIAN